MCLYSVASVAPPTELRTPLYSSYWLFAKSLPSCFALRLICKRWTPTRGSNKKATVMCSETRVCVCVPQLSCKASHPIGQIEEVPAVPLTSPFEGLHSTDTMSDNKVPRARTVPPAPPRCLCKAGCAGSLQANSARRQTHFA